MKKELNMFEWGMCIGQKMQVSKRCFGFPVHYDISIQKCNNVFDSGLVCSGFNNYDISNCKPILRTLDMMTDEEKKEFFSYDSSIDSECSKICIGNNKVMISEHYIDGLSAVSFCKLNQIDWLRSKGFCLNPEWFELGLAIKEDPE